MHTRDLSRHHTTSPILLLIIRVRCTVLSNESLWDCKPDYGKKKFSFFW